MKKIAALATGAVFAGMAFAPNVAFADNGAPGDSGVSGKEFVEVVSPPVIEGRSIEDQLPEQRRVAIAGINGNTVSDVVVVSLGFAEGGNISVNSKGFYEGGPIWLLGHDSPDELKAKHSPSVVWQNDDEVIKNQKAVEGFTNKSKNVEEATANDFRLPVVSYKNSNGAQALENLNITPVLLRDRDRDGIADVYEVDKDARGAVSEVQFGKPVSLQAIKLGEPAAISKQTITFGFLKATSEFGFWAVKSVASQEVQGLKLDENGKLTGNLQDAAFVVEEADGKKYRVRSRTLEIPFAASTVNLERDFDGSWKELKGESVANYVLRVQAVDPNQKEERVYLGGGAPQGEPEKVDPEKGKSEKDKSKKDESEKDESEKVDPKKADPKKADPEKVEPEKDKSEKDESEKVDPEKGKSEQDRQLANTGAGGVVAPVAVAATLFAGAAASALGLRRRRDS